MIKQILCSILASLLIVGNVTTVYAEEVLTQAADNIVISEIQTNGEGTGTTTQEFIELYNPMTEPVNIGGWSIVYKNSSGKESVLYTFTEPYLFMPATFVIGKNGATATSFLPDITGDFLYENGTSGLAATAGGLMLKDETLNIVDGLTWTSAAAYVNNDTVHGLVNGKSAQRKCNSDQQIVKTGSVLNDFYVDVATPSTIVCDEPKETNPPTDTNLEDDEDTTPTVTEEVIEPPTIPDRVRLPVVINELLIDPVSPFLDSKDEYIELYNPNNIQLDISGYRLVIGSPAKYTYTFPEESVIWPNGYVSITSGESPIALANTGGEVELDNDIGEVVDRVTYVKAVAGASWALNSVGNWAWTVTPTFAAQNTIRSPSTPPATIAKKTTSTSSKKKVKSVASNIKKTNYSVALPIQINELYPDPKSPQTDAADEFIELYNPHSYFINISDYTLIAGTTKKYTYTFPEGSIISPGGYVVIDSANTTISLANSTGEVRLINNFDKEIDVITYETAKTGWSFARDDFGKWQWTTTVTKAGQNTITAVIDDEKATKTDVAGVVAGTDSTPLAPAPQPLPNWALAVLGVAAVCYAAYEYRFEVRNSIYKFRANRTAG